MSDDIVAELDRWLEPGVDNRAVYTVIRRARDEIIALRETDAAWRQRHLHPRAEGAAKIWAEAIKEAIDTARADQSERDNEAEKAYGYLSRVFSICAPQCEPLPDLLGLCTQIDNLIAGYREEIVALRTYKQALEELASVIDQPPWHTDPQNGALRVNPQFVTRREIAAAIRNQGDERDANACNWGEPLTKMEGFQGDET